jgi:hypothetical protein
MTIDPIIERSPAQNIMRAAKLRAELKEILRQSVPTNDLAGFYNCGWAYVMPDFDKPNHSIVEWLSNEMPVYPHRVPSNPNQESAENVERAASS